MPQASERRLAEAERGLAHVSALLESYSYERVLERGFVLVRGPEGPVTQAEQATPGLEVALQFQGGEQRAARIEGEAPVKAKASPKRPRRKANDGRQGELL